MAASISLSASDWVSMEAMSRVVGVAGARVAARIFARFTPSSGLGPMVVFAPALSVGAPR